jgi:seryl-tRNA synthetase
MSAPNLPLTLGFEKKYKHMFNKTQNYLHKFNTDLSASSNQKQALEKNLATLKSEEEKTIQNSQEIKSNLTQKQRETEEILKIKNELTSQVKELQTKNKNVLIEWGQQKKSILQQISKLQEVKNDIDSEESRETAAFQEAWYGVGKQIDL